ncbi:hypothetical protein BJ742DRAFT_155857 [Cladochytrium replicatum]|nr:hypothetical protein BJ742DRAFT_155857 [Cladochytrium replicatum]
MGNSPSREDARYRGQGGYPHQQYPQYPQQYADQQPALAQQLMHRAADYREDGPWQSPARTPTPMSAGGQFAQNNLANPNLIHISYVSQNSSTTSLTLSQQQLQPHLNMFLKQGAQIVNRAVPPPQTAFVSTETTPGDGDMPMPPPPRTLSRNVPNPPSLGRPGGTLSMGRAGGIPSPGAFGAPQQQDSTVGEPSYEQILLLHKRGHEAWKFAVPEDAEGIPFTGMLVEKNGFQVRYIGRSVGDRAAISDQPLHRDPKNALRAFYYFEATVTALDRPTPKGPPFLIAVGVCTTPFDADKMIGEAKFSTSYFSDGSLNRMHEAPPTERREFGPAWDDGPGHTIGCGYDATRGNIFFTLDGKWVGNATTGDTARPYHAGVSVTHNFGKGSMSGTITNNGPVVLSINVGQAPFKFAAANAAATPLGSAAQRETMRRIHKRSASTGRLEGISKDEIQDLTPPASIRGRPSADELRSPPPVPPSNFTHATMPWRSAAQMAQAKQQELHLQQQQQQLWRGPTTPTAPDTPPHTWDSPPRPSGAQTQHSMPPPSIIPPSPFMGQTPLASPIAGAYVTERKSSMSRAIGAGAAPLMAWNGPMSPMPANVPLVGGLSQAQASTSYGGVSYVIEEDDLFEREAKMDKIQPRTERF